MQSLKTAKLFQKKSIFVWFILFFLAPHLIIGQNNNSTSSETLIPLEYVTFSPPAVVGESYNDPVFSTSIKRLTDSQSVFGFNGERAIFSADDKYFVVAVDLRVQKTRLHFNLKAKAPNNWMMYPLANKVLYWKGTISQEICMILNFSKQFIA